MNLIKILSFVAVSWLCGCTIKYRDVSTKAPFDVLVGSTFVTRVDLVISGVNAPPGYSNTIDYYSIHPSTRNWSGPELISRDTLPRGTRFTVVSVRQPESPIARERVQCIIRLIDYPMPIPVTVKIRLSTLTPLYVDEVEQPNQAPEPTVTAVTPRAAHESRQP